MMMPPPEFVTSPTLGDSLVVEIPNGSEVNQLIGVRGSNINQLQNETGTYITVQKASEVLPGSSTRRVTISNGDPVQRQLCAARILAQVHEFQSSGMASSGWAQSAHPPAQSPSSSSVIEIPNGPEVNFVIGRSGATIKALQEETATHIAVQRANEVPPGASVRLVTITGSETQRMRCIALMRAKVLEYQLSSATTAPPVVVPGALPSTGGELVIEIPNGLTVNHVIGSKGMTVNALQQETATHISIQRAADVPAGSSVRTVTISGNDQAARERCAALIQNKVAEYQMLSSTGTSGSGGNPSERANGEEGGASTLGPSATNASNSSSSSSSLVVEIPNGNEVNHLIGAKGITINALQQDTHTHISVQRASEVPPGVSVRLVTISGGTDIQRARCAELVRAKVLEYQLERSEDQPDAKRRRVAGGGFPPPQQVSYQMPYYGYGAVPDPNTYAGLTVDPYGQYPDPNHYGQYYMMGNQSHGGQQSQLADPSAPHGMYAAGMGMPPGFGDLSGFSAPAAGARPP